MMIFKDIDKLLTNKGCAIILSIACLCYFLLNLTVLRLAVAYAVLNTLCTTAAFGLFLYFIREIRERNRRKREKKETKDVILLLGKDTDPEICKRLGGRKIDGRCVVVETGIGDDGDVFLKVLKKR